MTHHLIGEYTQSIVDHLSAALQGQGVEEVEGEGKADIPVSLEIQRKKVRLSVRVESFSLYPGETKIGKTDRHTFNVRVSHVQVGDKITKAASQLSRVEGLINAAFDDWTPLAVAEEPKFLSSFDAEEDEPEVTSRVSRYQLLIHGD